VIDEGLFVLAPDWACVVDAVELMGDVPVVVVDEDDGVIEVDEDEDVEVDGRVANGTVCASRDLGEGASNVTLVGCMHFGVS
jgi:hypothetical protein